MEIYQIPNNKIEENQCKQLGWRWCKNERKNDVGSTERVLVFFIQIFQAQKFKSIFKKKHLFKKKNKNYYMVGRFFHALKNICTYFHFMFFLKKKSTCSI